MALVVFRGHSFTGKLIGLSAGFGPICTANRIDQQFQQQRIGQQRREVQVLRLLPESLRIGHPVGPQAQEGQGFVRAQRLQPQFSQITGKCYVAQGLGVYRADPVGLSASQPKTRTAQGHQSLANGVERPVPSCSVGPHLIERVDEPDRVDSRCGRLQNDKVSGRQVARPGHLRFGFKSLGLAGTGVGQ